MKLLFDQNLSRVLVSRLAAEYPDSAHVAEIGLDEQPDQAIWEYAGEHGFAVVSKDADFRQLAFVYGPPPKVVWLRVGNVSTRVVEELLRTAVDRMAEFNASADESFLVLNRTASRTVVPG